MTGSLPPLSEADWQAEFDKYKTIPQYEILNKGMGLESFKRIYWWEWGHRLLGVSSASSSCCLSSISPCGASSAGRCW